MSDQLNDQDQKTETKKLSPYYQQSVELRDEVAETKKLPVKEQVIINLSLGLTKEDAAKASGITEERLNEMQEADPTFLGKCDQAEQEMKLIATRTLKISMSKYHQHQAASWWLERKHNKEFGSKQISIGENGNTTVVFNMNRPTK